MKLTYKNIILLIIILIATILSAFFIIKIKSNNSVSTQPTPDRTYQFNQNSSSILSEVWNSYSDERYGFSLDYPSDLNMNQINNEKVKLADSLGGGYLIINGGASFYQKDGYGIILINIFDNSKIASLDEWLVIENKKVEHQVNVLEKRIKIDGYDAIVTYAKSVYDGQEESFKREKKTVFIKDGILFEINTRGIDHERVWNSFKFKK